MKKKLALLLSLSVCLLSFAAMAETPEDVEIIPVGDLEVYGITDAHSTMESRLLPDLDAHPELKPLFEHGPLPAVAKTYLLKTGNHVILVDTGWGNEQAIKGKTLDKLAELGIKPENITDIILTHLDMDHIGGLVNNGKAVFPNAEVWISKPEYDAWINGKIEKRSADAIRKAKTIKEIYGNRVKTFAWDEEILPGVKAIEASGHTPGHTAFDIVSGKNKLTIAGDLIHIAEVQLPHPEMSTIYDVDMKKAVDSRKHLLQRAVDDASLFAGMHFNMVSPVRAGENGAYFMRQPR